MDAKMVKFASSVVELSHGFDRYVQALDEGGFSIEARIYKESTQHLTDEGEVMLKKAAVMQRVIESC